MQNRELPPPIDPTVVREYVLNAHGDLTRVEQLVAQEPRLVNAVWDWGGGDWESGLGAAAHTGRKEIARFLLAHGARIDLFAAAMLDQLEIVRAALDAFPSALHVPGPHGIPLLAHAKIGGADSVVAHIEALLSKEEK
jgi:hypothetical protein